MTAGCSDPADRSAHSDRGASSVEYALLVAGIAAVVVLAVFAFGHIVNDVFTSDCTHINDTVSANIDASSDCG